MSKMKEAVHCWKINTENIDNDDPCGVYIWESQGEHALEVREVETIVLNYNVPIKTKKDNIGIEKAPKMAIITD
jgi:hypothetical protein